MKKGLINRYIILFFLISFIRQRPLAEFFFLFIIINAPLQCSTGLLQNTVSSETSEAFLYSFCSNPMKFTL